MFLREPQLCPDMGRGRDMRAGYALLKAIREQGNRVPFFIFAGSDEPEFRRRKRRNCPPTTCWS